MTWLRGKYWIYFYELVITLRPLRGTVRSESIRRLRRSQLTCKNKSNIFHSVLLDLFDADIQEGSPLLLLLFFFVKFLSFLFLNGHFLCYLESSQPNTPAINDHLAPRCFREFYFYFLKQVSRGPNISCPLLFLHWNQHQSVWV